MEKLEQIKRELKALVGNPELDNIIDEKIDDAWQYSQNKLNSEWYERERRYFENLKTQLSLEEARRMQKSHAWIQDQDESRDRECTFCGLDEQGMSLKPQFCKKK